MSMFKFYKRELAGKGMGFVDFAKKAQITPMTAYNRAKLPFNKQKIEWLQALAEATGKPIHKIVKEAESQS